MSDPDSTSLQHWDGLDADTQTQLRIAFGHYLDGLPPTCSLETKVARFRAWLASRGIDYADCDPYTETKTR
jgi:hypothetical protein